MPFVLEWLQGMRCLALLCGHMYTHARLGGAQKARTHTGQANLQGQLHYPSCPLRPYVRDWP